MEFNRDMIPKIMLTYEKDSKYKFLSSREKIYRFKNTLINGKIVILPEYINKNINNSSIVNTHNTLFNEEIFNKIQYLKDNEVINNYNSGETKESIKKKCQLYQIFSGKSKSYWEKKTKNVLMDIYNKECVELKLEPEIFYTKKDLLNYCFTNPFTDHFYSHNNKYFISNSPNSNMEEAFRLSPSKDISTYECLFNMFSISIQNEYYEETPYYFKKFRNDNLVFVINYINILSEPLNKSNLYRLFMFMIKDGLEEIFGNHKENSAKIIQKNWNIYKNSNLNVLKKNIME